MDPGSFGRRGGRGAGGAGIRGSAEARHRVKMPGTTLAVTWRDGEHEVIAALLVATIRAKSLGSSREEGAPALLADLGEGLRLMVRRPRLRLMLALLTAEAARERARQTQART